MARTNLPSGTLPISDHSSYREIGDKHHSCNLGNKQPGASEATAFPNYMVGVSSRFLFFSLLLATIFAFAIGRASRFVIFKSSEGNDFLVLHDQSTKDYLQLPKLIGGKKVPSTLYTAKNFDTSIGSASASVYLMRNVNDKQMNEFHDECGKNEDASSECKRDDTRPSASLSGDDQNNLDDADDDSDDYDDSDDADDDDYNHFPAGQHLLVDMKNVDASFLNSEVRLARAMIEVVNESKLTLLSYHCHKLLPMGVSCVGILLESHISFHTWPAEGVITLDLFTCGSGDVVPVLPIVKQLFAIPMYNGGERKDNDPRNEPYVVWTHKLRGFNPKFTNSPLAADLGEYILENSSLDLKVEVGSIRTAFQRIDIYDSIDANDVNYLSSTSDYQSYLKSLSNDGSYESLHPELFTAEREIYLDGVLQSTRSGNEAYHESLVHPAMFSHPNPKRVSIIGGGEGATLREVLKHSTLKRVNMIEIDEEMVHFSRKHLPDWNRCDDIKESTEWCGDDPRAGMFYEDALRWFLRRFSDDPSIKTDSEEPFDVIIMDALDPQDDVPFAEVLYNDAGFFRTLYNALTENGILVLQLGQAPGYSSPAEAISKNSKRDFVMKQLAKLFYSSHIYVEGRCGFRAPWSFVVAFKDEDSEKLWYRNAAEIDIDIQKRMLKTSSGTPTLKYFDGAIMESLYQIPTKGFETVHCRANPTPNSCRNRFRGDDHLSRHDPFVGRHLHKLNVQHKDRFVEPMCHVASEARRMGRDEQFGEWVGMCLDVQQ